jgi:hypothetical protein
MGHTLRWPEAGTRYRVYRGVKWGADGRVYVIIECADRRLLRRLLRREGDGSGLSRHGKVSARRVWVVA